MLVALALTVATTTASTQPATLTGCANLTADLAKARPGAKIVITGVCPAYKISAKSFMPAVTIDATGATFPNGGLYIADSTGIHMVGGTYGPNPAAGTFGLSVRGSHDISMVNGRFEDLEYGIVINEAEHIVVAHNRIDKIRNDSIRFFNSRFGNINSNAILGAALPPGSLDHPDGIQLASPFGHVSDVSITNNTVAGDSQGIGLFGDDHQNNGFDRITITGNYLATTYPQALAIQYCRNCTATGNTIVTLPGAVHTSAFNQYSNTGITAKGNVFIDLR